MVKANILEKAILYKYLLEISLFRRNSYFVKDKHVGDIVRTLPAISLFKECHLKNKKARIIVLTTENRAGLMEMNQDIDKVRVLSLKVLRDLEGTHRYMKTPPNLYRDAYAPEELIPIYHFTKECMDANAELLKIPDHIGPKSLAKARSYMEEKGIDPQKTLLLVPYAVSSSSLDVDTIKPVLDFYRESGYRLLTNAFGKDQKPAEGTEAIDVPVDVILSAVQQGMTVIGVQCGLLDAMEWMNLSSKMIKVFLLKTDRDKEFYSRRVSDHEKKIEKKDFGYTVAVSTDQDYLNLNDDLIRLSRSFIEEGFR